MSKPKITYVCHVCNEFFDITKSHATVQYCPYCGTDDVSQYSKELVEEGADTE